MTFSATLQAQYDNIAMVPDHPAILAGWQADAAALRATHPPRAIPYGPTQRQGIDLFGPADAPIAVFIHGGYWQRTARDWYSHMAAGLLPHGIATAIIGYDLCPEVTIRQIIDQCAAAVAALPRPPVLAIGHSAGGHLAAWLLARGLVPAALPISGVFDLAPLRETRIGEALALSSDEARALSPIHLPPPAGRMQAVVGGAESLAFRDQTLAMAAAWGASAAELPGENHFTAIRSLAEPDGALTRMALALIA